MKLKSLNHQPWPSLRIFSGYLSLWYQLKREYCVKPIIVGSIIFTTRNFQISLAYMHVYKLKLSMSLLFVNRNKKAMKTCGNCVDKEMNFAAKPLLFSMKGRKICWIITIDKGTQANSNSDLCLLHRNLLSRCFYSVCWALFPWHITYQ